MLKGVYSKNSKNLDSKYWILNERNRRLYGSFPICTSFRKIDSENGNESLFYLF